jgi:hypothetical protein
MFILSKDIYNSNIYHFLKNGINSEMAPIKNAYGAARKLFEKFFLSEQNNFIDNKYINNK